MKKGICVILSTCMVITLLTGCSFNNKSTNASFGEIKKVADMLYEMTYDDYSSEIPDESAYDLMSGELACSGVRNGNFVGRNFDFFMNQSPEFVVRTTAKENRYATIGVGRLANINSDDVESGLSQDKTNFLPWFIIDGINEKGLVCFSNVTGKVDGGDVPHTGTNPNAPDLNAAFMVRAILDNCATVDEAVTYIKNHNIKPMLSETFDLHTMISDPKKNCVVEYINNKVVVKEQNIMTNYYVNMDKIPEHPDGLERMQILKKHYDEGNTMQGMYNLMQRVKYTNSYIAANKWYSEIEYTYDQIKNAGPKDYKKLVKQEKDFEKEKQYIKKNGLRKTTKWWDTTHNTIYDIKNKKIWVTVHERYEEGPHKFSINLK